jgi:hypothetical protein
MVKSNVKIAPEKSCENCEKCSCDCKYCAKTCARSRKIHPLFATIVFILVIAVGFGILGAFAKIHDGEIANLKMQIASLKTENTENSVRENGVSYMGENGKTALEILKKSHKIETKDFAGVGEFVTAIDGIKAEDSKNFWAFYVNGTMASEGASTYKTKNGEKIEWRLDEIQ